ncbi:MAG TPA: adenylate/guanylate cyclase domain-containing protein [Candidatus Didemnitutus sp.]|nr:adenylate/guanylate cyclase domain-containing protein [Candidatus Didemnitutus sp.]
MSTVPPIPGRTPGQRTLAAILFTDVVGFSARMHADEMTTLKLLQHDFAEMKRLCTEHEGSVLKSTGDGLLLTFTSAVQAVACALAMQRQFAADGRKAGADEPLLHRIGIHLGDVVVQDEDVMGDGVNIAARLQSEAEPGGICISQTVYDVVHNKLEMQAVSLGARELKNIAQAMPVYRLLLDAQGLQPPAKSKTRPPVVPSKGVLHWPWIAAGITVVLVGAGIVAWNRTGSTTATTPKTESSAASATPVANPPAPNLSDELSSEAALRSDIQHLRREFLDKYDFDGLVRALRVNAEKPGASQSLQNMLRSAEALARFRTWMESALSRYSAQRPLMVQPLANVPATAEGVWLDPDRRLAFGDKTSSTKRDWPEIKPAEMGAIVLALIRDLKDGIPQRNPLLGAHAFARIYDLPALSAALPPLKGRAAKDAGSK